MATQIAFIRRHGDGDVDKMPNRDLFVIDAKPGAQPQRLTTTTAEEAGVRRGALTARPSPICSATR